MGALLSFSLPTSTPLATSAALGVPPGATGALSFDVVTSETPSFPNQIAEHVVEKGADVADNIRVGLMRVVLEVFVSNEPVELNSQWSTAISGPLPLTTPDAGGPGAAGNQPFPTSNPGPLIDKTWFTLPIGVPILGSLVAQEVDVPFAVGSGLPPTLGTTVVAKTQQAPITVNPVQLTHDLLRLLRDTGTLCVVFGTEGVYESMAIESLEMRRSAKTGTGAEFTIGLKEVRLVQTALVLTPKPTIPRAQARISQGNQATEPPTSGDLKSLAINIENFLGPGVTAAINSVLGIGGP